MTRDESEATLDRRCKNIRRRKETKKQRERIQNGREQRGVKGVRE